jgi:hypothetical protein
MEGKMMKSLEFNSPLCKSQKVICLAMVVLFLLVTACSKRPRDEYAQELFAGIDEVYAALEQYRSNPSGTGKPTDPVDMEVNGKSVTVTGTTAMFVSQSYAEIVGKKTQAFSDKLQTLNFQAFMDIQSDRGYDKWATATDKRLRETADKCIAIVARIKSEYKANPDSDVFKSSFLTRPYQTVGITPEDEIIFSVDMQNGVVIERVLKVDFRKTLDGVHKGDIGTNKK